MLTQQPLVVFATGRARSRFLVVGTFESTWIVRVLSLDPDKFMQVLSRQALPAKPESLCLIEIATGASAQVTSRQRSVIHVSMMDGRIESSDADWSSRMPCSLTAVSRLKCACWCVETRVCAPGVWRCPQSVSSSL